MPTTRRQATLQETGVDVTPASSNKPSSKAEKPKSKPKARGTKRDVEVEEPKAEKEEELQEPPEKKVKQDDAEKTGDVDEGQREVMTEGGPHRDPMRGTIERGHIYFFYRPKVQHEEVSSLDDVQRFHILLVPRPPQFAAPPENDQVDAGQKIEDEDVDMQVLKEGADAVPAKEKLDTPKKHYRLISVGKKKLPDPEHSGRKDTFWATVTAVGDDLHFLEKGLGESTYETKTQGTRHQAPSRLAGRGAYAIVNNDPRVPSKRETHLGYHLSHPSELGEVQSSLGIHAASSFVLQAKNPLAPSTGGPQVGLSPSQRANYPDWIMEEVFGKGGKKGRESYGVRLNPIEQLELLEYEGAELLLIASRSGEEGLNQSLGEERGHALEEVEKGEEHESTDEIFRELAMDNEQFPAEALEGQWI